MTRPRVRTEPRVRVENRGLAEFVALRNEIWAQLKGDMARHSPGARDRHGKVCSMLVNSADEARRWRELGALLLVYSTDVDVIYDGFNAIAKQLRGR